MPKWYILCGDVRQIVEADSPDEAAEAALERYHAGARVAFAPLFMASQLGFGDEGQLPADAKVKPTLPLLLELGKAEIGWMNGAGLPVMAEAPPADLAGRARRPWRLWLAGRLFGLATRLVHLSVRIAAGGKKGGGGA